MMEGNGARVDRVRSMREQYEADNVDEPKSPERDAAYWVCRTLYKACSCSTGKKPCARMSKIVKHVKEMVS